jgi:small ligand-binding sensory domain FIST
MSNSVRSAAVVSIPAQATLAAISEIHDETRAAFAQGGTIEFDVDCLESADLAFVQLVESARRDALAQGRDISLSDPVSEPVAQLLRRAGFLSRATPADIAFWFHGDLPQ